MTADVVVLPSAAALAADVATRAVAALATAQQERTRAALALTAGSIMEQVWTELANPGTLTRSTGRGSTCSGATSGSCRMTRPTATTVRRNGSCSAGPRSRSARRYSMPASDGEFGDDLDAAAAGYARTLSEARRADDTADVPSFDVVLLGIGPDGHCCSLFPDHPSARDDSPAVIAVRNSPKPPPLRLSLCFDALNSANEIWVVASGSGKADAAAMALASGAEREHVPAAGARGRVRTAVAARQRRRRQAPRLGCGDQLPVTDSGRQSALPAHRPRATEPEDRSPAAKPTDSRSTTGQTQRR